MFHFWEWWYSDSWSKIWSATPIWRNFVTKVLRLGYLVMFARHQLWKDSMQTWRWVSLKLAQWEVNRLMMVWMVSVIGTSSNISGQTSYDGFLPDGTQPCHHDSILGHIHCGQVRPQKCNPSFEAHLSFWLCFGYQDNPSHALKAFWMVLGAPYLGCSWPGFFSLPSFTVIP